MMVLPVGKELFHCGLLVMGCALILLGISVTILGLKKKKLKQRLETEYGKKRH